MNDTRTQQQVASFAAAEASPATPLLPQGIRRVNMQSMAILHAIKSPLFDLALNPELQVESIPLLEVGVFCWLHCAPAKEVSAAYAYTDTPRAAIVAKALSWLADVPGEALPSIMAAIRRDQTEVSASLTQPITPSDSKNA